MSVPTSFQRDENFVPITNLGFLETKDITFVAATTGAVGVTTLFTITGTVALNVWAFCTTNLSGTGTIEVGVSSSTACLANQQNATAIDNHEVWHDSVLAIGGQIAGHWHVVNEDVIQTIATNTVTGGVLTYYCGWIPLTEGATVTVN